MTDKADKTPPTQQDPHTAANTQRADADKAQRAADNAPPGGRGDENAAVTAMRTQAAKEQEERDAQQGQAPDAQRTTAATSAQTPDAQHGQHAPDASPENRPGLVERMTQHLPGGKQR